MKILANFLLRIWGFRITGVVPNHLKKKIYIVMPHTSNWDFILGILNKYALGLDVRYVAKHTLFRPPFGFLFRLTGGIPVDRTKKDNFVNQIVDFITNQEKISIAIAPEGTRKFTNKLKTGFYWIAYKSGLPLIFVKFDFGNKIVDYSLPFHATGDIESDMKLIEKHFIGVVGKNPKNFYLN
jgi:1-acyl-sn-glycerol-3-phosphate acyltransferase